jgi:hypothetical protein
MGVFFYEKVENQSCVTPMGRTIERNNQEVGGNALCKGLEKKRKILQPDSIRRNSKYKPGLLLKLKPENIIINKFRADWQWCCSCQFSARVLYLEIFHGCPKSFPARMGPQNIQYLSFISFPIPGIYSTIIVFIFVYAILRSIPMLL